MVAPDSMRLGCIVLAHRLPKQLASLLSALRHPQVQLYVHIDRRLPLAPFTQALGDAGVHDAVLLPRYPTTWGGPEVLDVELDGLAAGMANGCNYFVLLSGQDFPLEPIEEIVSFFENAGTRSYMLHRPVSESRARGLSDWQGRFRTDFYAYTVRGRRELCYPRGEDVSFLSWKGRILNGLLRMRSAFKPPRRHPTYVRPFIESHWWNLSRAAAEYALWFVKEHPDYRRYHTYTFCPDELFFHSILLGTDFASQHEVVNDDLRFIIWSDEGSHPRVLTTDDLPAMLESEKLFARKFDETVDGAVLTRLAEGVTA